MSPLPDIDPWPRRADVVRLLESSDLPTSDLTDAHMSHFFYAGLATNPDGVVGVQLFGADALLRSLVVGNASRRRGLGQKLVERAEQHARERGATTIYLLTTTAEAFFKARGYASTPRDRAPPSIQCTAEFSSLCPSNSAFLSKNL